MIKDYQEIPKPKQYIVLRNYIYRNFNKTIPFTHIKKLLKTGLFTIQSTQYNLYSDSHSFLYIEVYFEKMIWSNYIIHGGEKIIFNHIRTPLDSLILNDNFSYYRFIKKFKVLLKWLYGKRYIESPHLQKQALVTCDKITEFIGKLALQYNEYCLIASRMILLSIKIAKYNKKIKKRTKPLYGERLDRLNALYTKLSLEYGEGIKSLESTYRDEVISMMTPYKLYLEKYFIIY